jgi:hypothetical protein
VTRSRSGKELFGLCVGETLNQMRKICPISRDRKPNNYVRRNTSITATRARTRRAPALCRELGCPESVHLREEGLNRAMV